MPVCVLLLTLGPRLLPEYKDPHPGRLDITSAALSLAAILAVVYGVKLFAAGEGGILAAAAILLGFVTAIVFLRRQKTLKAPFLDLKLFRSHTFSTMLVVYLLVLITNFVAFLFIAQYLQLVLGMSSLEAGLWTLPWGIAFIIGSLGTSVLAARIRPTFVIAGGLVLAAAGFLILTQLSAGLPVIIIGSILFPLGLAPPIALATDLIIGAAPPERAGTASGLSEMSSELGGALGIAFIGSAATALYRGQLEENMPRGVASSDAEAALETFGGALSVAGQLPAEIGRQLTTAAQSAFTNSVALGFTLCAVTVLLAALLVVSIARKLKRAEAHAPSDQG